MAFQGTIIAQSRSRPRAVWQRTLLKASITSDSLPALEVVVRNVSTFGLGMTTQGLLPRVNEHISVRFSNGICASGRVVWVNGNQFGTELDEPISIPQLDAATQRQNEIHKKAIVWQVDQRLMQTEIDTSGLRPV